MSTEDQIVALEQSVAAVQRDFLVYLSENNRHMGAVTKVLTQQEANARDLQHDATILLGIASSQGKDIKAIQSDLSTIKEHLGGVEGRLGRVEERLDHMEVLLTQILARLPEKP